MGMPGIWELVLIFLIVLLIFGAGKIPKIAAYLLKRKLTAGFINGVYV